MPNALRAATAMMIFLAAMVTIYSMAAMAVTIWTAAKALTLLTIVPQPSLCVSILRHVWGKAVSRKVIC